MKRLVSSFALVCFLSGSHSFISKIFQASIDPGIERKMDFTISVVSFIYPGIFNCSLFSIRQSFRIRFENCFCFDDSLRMIPISSLCLRTKVLRTGTVIFHLSNPTDVFSSARLCRVIHGFRHTFSLWLLWQCILYCACIL